MVSAATFSRAGGAVSEQMWATIRSFVEGVAENWRRTDRGIWEVRGPRRHFVHSKVMCWLAVDRAITIAERLGDTADVPRWKAVRDEIRDDVLQRGWNERLQSFVQHYDAEHTDASLLVLPLVGFISADDPRMASTVRRIRDELEVNGLLRRYHPIRTDDGVGGEEGMFLTCTLWLSGYYTLAGDLGEAQRLLERVLQYSNHLGLFSEMADPRTGEALGNFPQAFTHVWLVQAIHDLDAAISKGGKPGKQEGKAGSAQPR